jgi:hypothetical protein
MQAWARRLGTLGVVVTFDYPYLQQGRKAPDKAPVLLEAHRAAFDDVRRAYGARPVIFTGKSMGSRMGVTLAGAMHAAGEPGPVGVVCFGYPLRALGSGALRDQVLCDLRTPILFVQGTRDHLCPLEDLAKVRPAMVAPNELFVVEGGDHSLELRKKDVTASGRSQDAWDAAVLAAILAFVERLTRAPSGAPP